MSETELTAEERGWQKADEYFWAQSCWVQQQYDPANPGVTYPEGGTPEDCPPGIGLIWVDPAPPISIEENVEFRAAVQLTINNSLFQTGVEQSFGYHIPHFATYGCQQSDDMFCLPEVDPLDEIIEINQLAAPGRAEDEQSVYDFEGRLRLPRGNHMVVSNVNFYNAVTGERVIVALGCYTNSVADTFSAAEIFGIVVGCLAVVGLIALLIYFYLRFRKERAKVRELSPEKYPKGLPAPVADADALEEFAKDGTIDRKSFIALERLGIGAYGEVFKGALFRKGTPVLCAIKSLKEEHRHTLADKFLSEAEVMRDLRHSNIVRIIGVSGVDESERAEICILMEFLPEGDLCHYLRKNTQISEAERLSFCYQIADACAYIANHGLVHRDLAARNCLLGSTGPHGYPVCKIGDFGLARALEGSDTYTMLNGGLMPIRWMAVESITAREFSETSDVWAYGVTCWEIYCEGKVPYADTMSYNLAASIASGLRLDMPHTCGAEMKELVTSCWYKHAEDRPKFAVIALRVEDLFEQAQRLVPDSEPHTLESKEKQMEKLKQKIDAKGSIGLDGYERIHSTGYVAADHVVQGNSPDVLFAGYDNVPPGRSDSTTDASDKKTLLKDNDFTSVNIAQAIDVKNSNSIQSQPCSAQSGVNANGAEDSAYYTYTDGNQQRAADRETGTNSALVTPASGTNLTRVLPADTDYVEIVRGSRTANEVEDSHDDGYMSAVGTDADGSEEMSYAQFNRDMSDVPLQ